MKIAVVGSGISGLSAAFYLSKKYKVDLFEQDDHFGGHSYTYDIKKNNKTIPVDLGFIVFNELTYPNLIKFFNELSVPYEKSDMSFSVSIQDSNIEYGGRGLKAIFANKLNVFNLNFLRMIKEIMSFYQTAPTLIKKDLNNETLGSYLDRSNLSKYFKLGPLPNSVTVFIILPLFSLTYRLSINHIVVYQLVHRDTYIPNHIIVVLSTQSNLF